MVLRRASLIVACLSVFVPVEGFAEEHTGRVTLRGMPVPGARVTASRGDQRVTATTNDDGLYRFASLADGPWTIAVEMRGFTRLTRDVSVAPGGAPALVELTMQPFAEITRGLPPPAPPSLPAPARASPRAAEAAPRTAPAPARPPASPAPAPPGLPPGALPRPGVAAAPNAAPAAALSPFPDDGLAASGDSFLVNGSTSSGAAIPSISQAQLNAARRAAGIRLFNGNVSVSGGGSALDARSPSFTGLRTSTPDYRDLNVTAVFSGPVRIPWLMRTARTMSFNYQRAASTNATTLSETMPSLLQRTGDFSQTVDGFGRPVVVRDPVTGIPFADNRIPVDRLSPQALALLAYYPRPDAAATGLYNYQVASLSANRSDTIGANLNQLISDTRQQIGATISYGRTRSENTSLFGFDGANRGSNLNLGGNWATRMVPWLTQMRVRHTYTRSTNSSRPNFSNVTNVSGDAGITGNDQSPDNWGPPSLTFSGGIAGLSDIQFSRSRTQTHSSGVDAIRTLGRHGLTFGGSVRRQQIDTVAQQNARGGFTFNGLVSGHDFADFLLGIPATSSMAFGNADKHFSVWNYDAYLTDDFRISPNFTVNVGVRWEFELPVSEGFGRLVNLDVAPDFTAAAPVLGSDGIGPITGRRYPGALIDPDPTGIQPRVGIAWRPVVTSSLVLRAGYGMYRNTNVYQSMANLLAQQPPLSRAFNAVNGPSTPLTLANGFVAPVSTTLNTAALDPDFTVGVVHRWQASVQRDLPAGLMVTGTYFAGHGDNLPQAFLPNTVAPGADNPCPGCPSGFVYVTSGATSNQHALQVQLRRRLRAGLTWTTAYTIGKATDNAASFTSSAIGPAVTSGGGGLAVAQNWLDLDAERGPSTFDQRHLFTVESTYSTGQGASSLGTGLRSTLLNGWTLTTRLNAGSGLPRTPIYRVSSVAGVNGTVRAQLTGEPIDGGADGYYANPAAFAPPAPGTWGNAPRNSIRGPAQFSLNAALSRGFTVRPNMTLTWQLDAQNLLNRVTYSTIDTSVSSAQFGLPTGTNSMRRIRTSLRMNF